ncbi:MAG: hypothetical protein ACI9V1_002470 [Spirosomataceae bacterium]|jgi:hypothetical protein
MNKILLTIIVAIVTLATQAQQLAGAWELKMKKNEVVILATENYLTYTMYNSTSQAFTRTWGGPYKFEGGKAIIDVEFSSANVDEVGKEKSIKIRTVGNEFLKISTLNFKRIDDNNETPLAGGWQISQRATSTGEMQPMKPGARKTLKIITGSRFQWIAMNTETGVFSGTGGGTYTLEGGIYTEQIEFFSKDGSRVGASLSFNAEVDDTEWQHSGKSSKGKPIKEVWSKIK